MRVLLLVNRFYPEICSASQLFLELAETLIKTGHKVTVLTGFPSSYTGGRISRKYKRGLWLRESINGINVIRVRMPYIPRKIPLIRGLEHFFFAGIAFVGGVFSEKQDVMLTYSPPLPLGLTSYLLGKIKRIPFVINVQDLYPQTPIDLGLLKNKFIINFMRSLERFIYNKAKYITVHSDGNRDYVRKRTKIPEKVVTIPNWADVDNIRPANRYNEFREQHKLGKKFIVSYAGTIGFAQDLETIIKAAQKLKDKKDILFLIIGEGVGRDKLIESAKKMNLNNIKFLPLQQSEKYPSILTASDVCLVTLKKEHKTPAVPGKILSIMASSRPVLASLDLKGDAPKLIKSANCGISVNPENPDEMAKAIMQLFLNQEWSKKLGENGRKYAVSHLSRSICVKKYEDILHKSLADY